MGVGAAIGVQILGLAVVGLAPQLVEPGLGFLKGGEMLYRGLLLCMEAFVYGIVAVVFIPLGLLPSNPHRQPPSSDVPS